MAMHDWNGNGNKNDMADKRYGFYERFSTKQEEWYQFRFDSLELRENMYILDVGGGYGTPWMKVWEQIPAGCTIVMLDKDSKGRDYLKNHIKYFIIILCKACRPICTFYWNAYINIGKIIAITRKIIMTVDMIFFAFLL